ncbi:MAG: hypothetical protein KAR20_01065 [Candidatus Heimdallarchaeota archaeon]|nr:hypothetical protein [Candidatus Heimdallarchaeota archaeon]
MKSRIGIIVINTFLFAALFGLVTLNKELFRPASSNTYFFNILTGCFPNFIAAYLISLAFVPAVVIRKPKSGRLIIYVSSILVFIILTIEELKPMWGASTQYDPFDILASGVGSLLAILTFEIIVFLRRSRNGKIKIEHNTPDLS